MATQIAAKAREARLSHVVIESGQGYHSLESLKATSKNSARLLLEKCKLHDLPRLDPMAVLKKIQSPEFWETERRYLENPGCLAKRQTRSVTTMPTSAFPLPSPEPITPEISQYMEQTWPPASIPPVHIGERDVHPNNTLHNPATQRSQMNEKKDAMLPEASNQIGDQMNAHGKRKLVKEARVTGNFSSKHCKTSKILSNPLPQQEIQTLRHRVMEASPILHTYQTPQQPNGLRGGICSKLQVPLTYQEQPKRRECRMISSSLRARANPQSINPEQKGFHDA
ncbi:hypothetical protein RJ035_008330 [Blastomyces gilchristii]